MAEKTNPFRNVQVTFRRSSPLTKIIVIVTIVLCTIALVTLRWVQSDIEAQTKDMREEAAQLIDENAELEEKIDGLGSVDSITNIAKSELDMVDPNTTFFEPQSSEANETGGN